MLSFHEDEEEGLPDSFLSNFPSLIQVDIHAKVTDPSVAKSMMGCLLSSLKANGRWQPFSLMPAVFSGTTCANLFIHVDKRGLEHLILRETEL